MYLAPMDDAPTRQWPKIFAKSTIFALTAHNPMGVDAPAAANRAANDRLEYDLTEMRTTPRAWWHTFGFNAAEGWREDGFAVAFANEERVYGRMAVLKLARKYRQKAVYVYSFEDGHLMREVLFVGERYGRVEEGSKTRMAVLTAIPKTPLATRQSPLES